MSRSLSLRAAALATAFALTASLPLRAAEAAAENDDAPAGAKRTSGQILKMGSRVAAAEIAPASNEGEQALQRMKLPPGLVATLWAAEPMLANPVAFNFDEKGRIFVAETYRYRSSVLDIRDYMWTLENELANRTLEDLDDYFDKDSGNSTIIAISNKPAKQKQRPVEAIEAE